MKKHTKPSNQPLKPGESITTLKKRQHHALLSAQADPPPLPKPNETGTLSNDDQSTLWHLVSFIGKIWEIENASELTEGAFKYYLSLKTTDTPSYLTAYRIAVSIYKKLEERYGEQAPYKFYAPDGGSDLPGWDIARQWVIKEFLIIYVTQGAFKAYGWKNYYGYVGGPYNNPQQLPYRPYSPRQNP